MSEIKWSITEQGYLQAPGCKVLVYNNDYAMGRQSGIELIHHNDRVMTGGDLIYLHPKSLQVEKSEVKSKIIDRKKNKICLQSEIKSIGLQFETEISIHGPSIKIEVHCEKPNLPEIQDGLFYTIELFPASFFDTSYHIGNFHGVFNKEPERLDGDSLQSQEKPLMIMGTGNEIDIAPENPLKKINIRGINAQLNLVDIRDFYCGASFQIMAQFSPEKVNDCVGIEITPNIETSWRDSPILGISQVGYHPEQTKQVILELDKRVSKISEIIIERLHAKKGLYQVKGGIPIVWGEYMNKKYARFDFSEIKTPGLYQIRYENQKSNLFKISAEIYQDNVYQPSLHTFFPMQMCHMSVRDSMQVWHGRCHMDDALQAPTNHQHFDSYQQYETTDTEYEISSHIPGLAIGGWHDAGDFDLAAGSQAETVYYLCLAQDEFHPKYDKTTVNFDKKTVLMYQPDGIPDIIQQIIHGVHNLLTGYKVAGHSFAGIIAGNMMQYTHIGDASTMTDNKIYDSSLPELEVNGNFSGTHDDRWAFTNRDTNLEYCVITALASAARVLKDYEKSLSDEAIKCAVQSWDYEQSHIPIHRKNVYTPDNGDVQEIQATIELYLTTNDEKYLDHLVNNWGKITANIQEVGWTVSRIMLFLSDENIEEVFLSQLHEYKVMLDEKLKQNPYSLPFEFSIWGVGWQVEQWALTQYFLIKKYPQVFDKDNLLRVVNYMLGCHPSSNNSFVSGVGRNSTYPAYGMMRAFWTYYHGGVVSGTALIRPDFLEFKNNYPFLYQQTEYVISGTASFIFIVLAADNLLNQIG
jgi:hypothetical protein